MKFFVPLILLAVGFFSGWHFRGQVVERDDRVNQPSERQNVRPHVIQKEPADLPLASLAENSLTTEPLEDENGRLNRLLNERRFAEALEHYQEAQRDGQNPQLRDVLLGYMRDLKARNLENAFVDLVDAYLSEFYDDIEVMLLLADFNLQLEYYFEAVNIYQLANEYVYTPGAKKTVTDAFERAIKDLSQSLLDQGNVSLSQQVYFHAVSTGLMHAEQKLAQAQLYVKYGHNEFAVNILADIQNDSLVSGRAQDLLSQLTSSGDVVAVGYDRYESSIALEQLGNQYIVALYIEGEPVRLLIDTGASVTTMTRSAYERVFGGSQATVRGTRMFRTANGMAKGEIVRFSNVSFAGYNLSASDIAVLDFDMSHSIDGLLGMNMLGKFRFNIEPETRQLLLTPLF